jgi:methionine-rich copper-binding protein CopC
MKKHDVTMRRIAASAWKVLSYTNIILKSIHARFHATIAMQKPQEKYLLTICNELALSISPARENTARTAEITKHVTTDQKKALSSVTLVRK